MKDFLHGKAINFFKIEGERKLVRRKRRTGKIVFSFILILTILTAQPAWHIFQLRSAQDRFDLSRVNTELTWFKHKAPLSNKIPLIRDSAIWLDLNQGKDLSDQDILIKQDDKHRFWLLQVKLQKNNIDEANQVLAEVSSASIQNLGQGLIDLVQGKYDVSSQKLNAVSDLKLTKEEKVLKALALSRCWLSQGNEPEAQKEWDKAHNMAPKHPSVVEEEFDLALIHADWAKAEQLVSQLELLPRFENDFNFKIKKALLYLSTGKNTQWEAILQNLNKTPEGKPYQSYLQGIKYYQAGDWKTSRVKFKEALTGQTSAAVRQDAQKALEQVNERLSAEAQLHKY